VFLGHVPYLCETRQCFSQMRDIEVARTAGIVCSCNQIGTDTAISIVCFVSRANSGATIVPARQHRVTHLGPVHSHATLGAVLIVEDDEAYSRITMLGRA
jgi:hypothetical protein